MTSLNSEFEETSTTEIIWVIEQFETSSNWLWNQQCLKWKLPCSTRESSPRFDGNPSTELWSINEHDLWWLAWVEILHKISRDAPKRTNALVFCIWSNRARARCCIELIWPLEVISLVDNNLELEFWGSELRRRTIWSFLSSIAFKIVGIKWSATPKNRIHHWDSANQNAVMIDSANKHSSLRQRFKSPRQSLTRCEDK